MLQGALASLVALVSLALLAGTRAEPCPHSCTCGETEGEREYLCQGFSVRGKRDDFVRIVCNDERFSCASMPAIPLSNNGTLSSVGLTRCPLPDTFHCLLELLGATDVQHIVLNGVKERLKADHVRGLGATMLMMVNAGEQTEIPYDVLAALPSLRDFRIRDAKLQLPGPSGTIDGPLPPLKFVELSSDSIGGLPPGALGRFAGVPELHLWDNHIENVTEESFLGLEALESLDLSRNSLGALPPRAFRHAPRLRALQLVATALREIATGALTGMQSLERVLIKFGQSPLTLGSRALADLPSLTNLTIDNTPLAPLPADLFQTNHSKLQEMIITTCGLKELPTGIFEGMVVLQSLNLEGNALEELATDVFRPLKALRVLNLNSNRIQVLPDNLFSGLKRLLSVSADHNQLNSIAHTALQGAVNMQDVSLAGNHLTLDPGPEMAAGYELLSLVSPFGSLIALQRLILRDNHIAKVFGDWRFTLPNLRRLDLSGNRLSELSASDVQFLNSDLVVDLQRNRISTIELFVPLALWPQEPRASTSAVILLDHNPYRCDCLMYSFVQRLRGTKAVTTEPRLDIGEATCVQPPALKNTLLKNLTPDLLTCALIEEDCPSNCKCDLRPSSETLELDCDKELIKYPKPQDFGLVKTRLRLRSVPNELSSLPEHVASLNLSGIGLEEVPKFPKTVSEVDLSNNSLIHPPGLLTRNMTISLRGNPFICDCSNAEDVEMLKHYKQKIVDYANVFCNENESPWNVDAARLCDLRRAALLGGALAVLGLLAVVLAGLTYKYSLEIRVFLFSRGWCLKLCPPEEEHDENLLYDAFVSFSQKDARWVAEELVPRLETTHKMRLCVHYRDWLVGDMIPAQIARSVEQSRRTIVVLSKNFLESSWAALEFRAAHLRSQKERRARVLVVVLEEIPPECEIDAELRAYLSTNTYLKWGDPWFWKKLVYALAHTRSVVAEDKVKMGGLAARLTADGKIVNDAAKVVDTQPRF